MNGNIEKLASFVSCDVLIVDVANEYVEPLAPTPRKPDVREPRFSVPKFAVVAEAYANDPRVVDELVNVCSAVHVFVSASRVDEANVQVDVEKLYTSPLAFTASAPVDIDGKFSAPENVDDAVENRPLVNPIVVDVEL